MSFSVSPGEIVLVAGPSGCGKTTLLRCLNGLIPHSYRGGTCEGTLRLGDKDLPALSIAQISQHVGTVLQSPEKQIVGSRVASEVAFGLENQGVARPEMRRRVTAVMEDLELSPLAGRDTFHLSGGEKQRVALAGVLVMEPRLLLLDEPLSNLDPASAAEALRLIRRLADSGKAVILIEHRVEDALSLNPDRALLLQEGKQVYGGDIPGFLERADPRQLKLPAGAGRPPRAPSNSHQLSFDAALTGPPLANQGPLLEFRGVTFQYDGAAAPAVSEASLPVNPGTVLAILGANGAGKSTLLKLGIGLLRPRSGQVFLGGNDAAGMTTATMARTVGYAFQDPARMFFAATVREEVAFGPRNLGYDQARVDRNVAAALKALDVVGLADRSPLSLSYGQQKRVSIAAVVAMESRVLLLDEPTAGQDYQHTRQFMDAIAGLPHFEAIAFITHDLDLALEYANQVCLMSDGRIRSMGAPGETLRDPELLKECRLRPTSRWAAAFREDGMQ